MVVALVWKHQQGRIKIEIKEYLKSVVEDFSRVLISNIINSHINSNNITRSRILLLYKPLQRRDVGFTQTEF
jgi:hypothetical protein